MKPGDTIIFTKSITLFSGMNGMRTFSPGDKCKVFGGFGSLSDIIDEHKKRYLGCELGEYVVVEDYEANDI